MKYFNNKYLLITFLFLIQYINSKNNKDDDDYSICGTDIKCSNKGGTCNEYNNNFYCTCSEKYATYPDDNEILCNYERKRQLKAFLLELFLTYGAGHFYVKNYKYAIPKLIVFIFLYCLFIFLRIVTKAKEENKTANLIICINAIICFIGMITWQLIDVFKFGYNKYKDGNGIELYPM
jgi:hypothetical protein